MRNIESEMLLSMTAELMKTADLSSTLAGAANLVHGAAGKKALGLGGAMLGHGAAIGAAGNALYKGYKGYSEAKDQGADTGTAMQAGLGGAATGAMNGAVYGGALGAGAGTLIGHYHPKAEHLREALSTEKNWTGALGRFGQRQMHGITGWTPEKGLESIRGGTFGSQKAVNELEKIPGADAALGKARKVLDVDKGMVSGGLTNLPGIAKVLAGKGDIGRVEALKRMAGHQWHSQGGAGKAMMLGMTALPLATALSSHDGTGEGKGEQIGNVVGSTAGALVGSALPFYPQGKVMEYAGKAGKKIGKGVDWLRGSHSPDNQGMEGQHYPSETVPMNPGAGEVMR